MFLQIFERYKTQIQKIITLDDEAISAIISALQSLPLVFHAVVFVAETAEKTQKISKKDALDIISLVALLTALSEDNNFSNEEAIDLVSNFVEKSNSFPNLSDEEFIQLRKRLFDLLDNNSNLKVVYTASKVFNDYERIITDVKIVTDIRPVFGPSVNTEDETIRAVTVTHTVKIEYKNSEGEKEFYAAFDSIGLEQLHNEISNALQKNDAIQSMLENVQIISIGSDPEQIYNSGFSEDDEET